MNIIDEKTQLIAKQSWFSRRNLIKIAIALSISLIIILQYKQSRSARSEGPLLIHGQNHSTSNYFGFSKNSGIICQWYFLNYTPSAWETTWTTNIEELQKNICGALANAENLDKTVSSVERLAELQKFGRNRTQSDKKTADVLLSKMFYRQECIDPKTKVSFQGAEVSQLIEPLIGLLRDPLTVCDRIKSVPTSLYDEVDMQSKRYFLLAIAAPYSIHLTSKTSKNFVENSIQTNKRNPHIIPWMYQRLKFNVLDPESDIYTRSSLNILIDLGSAYFDDWGGANNSASGRWFYEHYKRFGVKFDRILAYEANAMDHNKAWKQLPDDVFPVYTLLNVGCATSGKFSPWVMLQGIAKPHDHVVIKLDVDTPDVEIPLMDELLRNASISALVDELFFEYHVNVNEMNRYWVTRRGEMKDSYALVTKLRQIGIRMHSWP